MQDVKVSYQDMRDLVRFYLKFSDFDEVEPTKEEINKEIERLRI